MIKEMQQKINEVQAELEERRIEIENIGSDIMELILEMEGGGINKKERMKIEEKKTKKENEKMNRLEEFNRIVSNSLELSQTFSNILKTSYVYMYIFH